MILGLCSDSTCHLEKKRLFNILQSKNLRRNTFGQVLEKFILIHKISSLLDPSFHLCRDVQINIFFLFSYDFSDINVRIKKQVFVKLGFWKLSWKDNALYFDNITRLSSIYKIASKLQMNGFRNGSALQLLRSLLHFELLKRPEFGVTGEES